MDNEKNKNKLKYHIINPDYVDKSAIEKIYELFENLDTYSKYILTSKLIEEMNKKEEKFRKNFLLDLYKVAHSGWTKDNSYFNIEAMARKRNYGRDFKETRWIFEFDNWSIQHKSKLTNPDGLPKFSLFLENSTKV